MCRRFDQVPPLSGLIADTHSNQHPGCRLRRFQLCIRSHFLYYICNSEKFHPQWTSNKCPTHSLAYDLAIFVILENFTMHLVPFISNSFRLNLFGSTSWCSFHRQFLEFPLLFAMLRSICYQISMNSIWLAFRCSWLINSISNAYMVQLYQSPNCLFVFLSTNPAFLNSLILLVQPI